MLKKIFFKNWYFQTLIASLILTGLVISGYVYFLQSNSEKASLLARATTISELLRGEGFRALTGTANDINDDSYNHLKSLLSRIVSANPDVRFVYALGKDGDRIFFYADSEDPNSPDYSPPGQEYYEASLVAKKVFSDGVPVLEFESDRWGTWFSALSPVIDDKGVAAVIGMDISIHRYFMTIAAYTLLPLSVVVFLITIAISGYKIRKKEIETLELKSQFITYASHELRSPLSGIRWAAELLIKDNQNNPNIIPEKQFSSIKHIHATTVRVLQIVRDLLSITAIDGRVKNRLKFTKVDIKKVIQNTISEVELVTKEKEVTINLASDFPNNAFCLADEIHIQQIFSNIISNSVKYSFQKGIVDIKYVKEKGMHSVSIIDHGIGIPKQDKKMVLQGFYRSKNARSHTQEGTGLGLYLVARILDTYDGEIEFDSREGEGSTFIIKLPITS